MLIAFLKATRPQTLIVGIMPVGLASLLAYQQNAVINSQFFLLSLLLVFALQISVNYFNDAIDFEKGADHNRIGPKRMTQEGKLSPSQIKIAASLLLVFSAIIGIPYIKLHWLYLPFGITSLYFAYGYTGGPYPLAYKALGEAFVFLYFGLVATLGTFYALTLEISLTSFHLACLIGLNAVFVIATNNLRDFKTDQLVHKRTLCVVLGPKTFSRFLITLVIAKLAFNIFFYQHLLMAIISTIINIFFLYKLSSKQTVKIFPISIFVFLIEMILLMAALL
ncbi:MAG: 1,4-dihydroxy-2-naphthoate octaprenyltransferase [Bacteriovoracaceae bacterium]